MFYRRHNDLSNDHPQFFGSLMQLKGYKIGVIGLGLMGGRLAQNLNRAGGQVVIHNRSSTKLNEFTDEGMVDGKNPAGVVKKSDIIILMLPDTKEVRNVLGGKKGLIAALSPGKLVIDMGTTEVLATKKFAKMIHKKGAMFIDAPVSGGTSAAEEGSLTIMAGGDKCALKIASPIFLVLGDQITHVGDNGAGQIAKTANQIIVGLTIGAVAEALVLAKKAGVNPLQIKKALVNGFADSQVLKLHGERMIKNNFVPGGRCVTQCKDMIQANSLANQLGLDLPATKLGGELFNRAIEMGLGELDHSALIKLYDSEFN